MGFVVLFLVLGLIIGIIYGFVSLLPEGACPAEKLIKQHGLLANRILGNPAGEVTLPLELQNFAFFHIKGNSITDVFTQLYNNETLFSFLVYGHTFQTKWSLSNPLPGSGCVGQTHLRCWLGKLPVNVPDAEVFYRRLPQDVSPFCTQKPFLCGNKEWDEKYVFAGDSQFVSFISPEFISWLEKNRLYVMISSDWLLLVDPKETIVPNDKSTWQNQMQDMSVWISLKDILVQK